MSILVLYIGLVTTTTNPADPPKPSEPEPFVYPRAIEWGLHQFDAHEDSAPRISIGLGLSGLGFMLALIATATPIAINIVEEYGPVFRPDFLRIATLYQSIFLPPFISGAIVVSAAFFWYVPISIRFLVASALTVPAGLLFIAMASLLDTLSGSSFHKTFFAMMFALFVGTATTALTIQMWSPWALSHHRTDDRRLPSLGTRSLFELTGITAISFAVFITLSNDPNLNSSDSIILFTLCAGFGILGSLAGIGMFIAFLRKNKSQHRIGIVALLLTFGAASLQPCTIAIVLFGWNALLSDLLLVLLMSAYGMLVIGIVSAIHLWWLRICGWQCVSRRSDN